MGVTDRNILLFLAQIEEQIDYIVQARERFRAYYCFLFTT